MKVAIIGTGNVGAALARKWAVTGHEIYLGVRDKTNFKGMELLENPRISAYSVTEAVELAEVILLATPAHLAVEIAKSLGDTDDKIIIDAMNIVFGKGPEGFSNTADAILANTATNELAKCFNTTGFNNMENPEIDGIALDNFVAGDSARAKDAAISLSKDLGFAVCYDVGGNDKFELMEQFAWFWINLALVQGQGREIGFKLLRR